MRSLVALVALIVGCGLFSSSVGSGALPATSLPPFGATGGDGSLSTVAEVGDVNGDGFNDYAVGLPSSDAGGADSGIVYVFLGHGGPLPATPTAVNLAAASFTITGHGGEMLGYSIVGDDVNGDHLSDIAIGAPMAGAPGKTNGGAVYVIFGRSSPGEREHHDALADRADDRRGSAEHDDSGVATTASSRTRTRACRSRPSRTSTATATTTSPSARPTPTCTSWAAAAWRCCTASPRACTSRSTISGRRPTRTSSTSTSRRSRTRTRA